MIFYVQSFFDPVVELFSKLSDFFCLRRHCYLIWEIIGNLITFVDHVGVMNCFEQLSFL